MSHLNREDEMQRTAKIAVGGVPVEIRMFDDERARVVGIWEHSVPLALSEWPIDAAAVSVLANDLFRRFNCRSDRRDATWALMRASQDFYQKEDNKRFFFAYVPTKDEARELSRAACAEAHDGL
jgi:hypothetical protein